MALAVPSRSLRAVHPAWLLVAAAIASRNNTEPDSTYYRNGQPVSRIDQVYVNDVAFTALHDCRVEHHEELPGHRVVHVEFDWPKVCQ